MAFTTSPITFTTFTLASFRLRKPEFRGFRVKAIPSPFKHILLHPGGQKVSQCLNASNVSMPRRGGIGKPARKASRSRFFGGFIGVGSGAIGKIGNLGIGLLKMRKMWKKIGEKRGKFIRQKNRGYLRLT